MSLDSAIEADGLCKAYGNLRAVDSFTLEVPQGVVLGFLGPNGAGKTTVIRMLATLIEQDRGTFSIAGVPGSRPAEIRRRLGVLAESAGYPEGQSGRTWLTYHAELFGHRRADAEAVADMLLADVGLTEPAYRPISTYSRGMRQRLGVARALVNNPRVVMLDEPTLGLDPRGQRELLALVRRIATERGVTVVLSTHMLGEVETTCDRVLILHRGRVVADGTVAEVVRRAAAPRRCSLSVPPELRAKTADLLRAGSSSVTITDVGLSLELADRVSERDASEAVLRPLLDAGIPVTGFSVESGRLSDAFLAMTEEEAS
jgi:ABC-2 type transport system ATP-binding protein